MSLSHHTSDPLTRALTALAAIYAGPAAPSGAWSAAAPHDEPGKAGVPAAPEVKHGPQRRPLRERRARATARRSPGAHEPTTSQPARLQAARTVSSLRWSKASTAPSTTP